VHRIIHPGIFIVLFVGILDTVSLFRGNCLLHCGDLHATLVEWLVNSRNLFERELTTVVKLIILATLAIAQQCLVTCFEDIGTFIALFKTILYTRGSKIKSVLLLLLLLIYVFVDFNLNQ
jgi:hypothetical protein